jgi:malate dehydrogenase (quinone)
VERHAAKVYGNAKLGAPPMSVPHLDTRTINGKKQLFFGPYAGFSTRFLKNGSYLDLPASLRPGNLLPISMAGMKNMQLTTYLIGQVLQSPAQRMQALREYFPDARDEDWELRVAGQRVQIIKRTEEELGMIQFGTEVVTSADGSLAALLGASPGASTSAAVILDVIAACFPEQLASERWQKALRTCIPSWGVSLADDPEALARLRSRADSILEIGQGARGI